MRTTMTALVIATTLGAMAQSHTVDAKASNVEWVGKKVTGQHSGGIMLESGELTTENGALTGVNVVINMTSITNGDISDAENSAKLVVHLKSDDFFNVEEFPKATFKATSIEAVKGADDSSPNYKVTGDLDLKGKTSSITFDARVDMKDGKTTAVGAATFDRSKHNVRYGSGSFFEGLGDKMIYDDVELTFNIVTAAKK